MKMSGPYSWECPSYWMDPKALSNTQGGAYGFFTGTPPPVSLSLSYLTLIRPLSLSVSVSLCLFYLVRRRTRAEPPAMGGIRNNGVREVLVANESNVGLPLWEPDRRVSKPGSFHPSLIWQVCIPSFVPLPLFSFSFLFAFLFLFYIFLFSNRM